MWPFISVLTLLLFATSSDALQVLEPVVQVHENLSIVGSVSHTAFTKKPFLKFNAIPYAEAPVGRLRFQPPIAFNGVHTVDTNASALKHKCPQLTDEYENVQHENCLTLSVSSPLEVSTLGQFYAELNSERLFSMVNFSRRYPVMVYFHGGGFFKGGSQDYEADYLLERDVVLVVVQYRLGPLGFLSLKNDRIPGNVGILDMILALEWVHKNIRHFGGLASRVTIFGESAGSIAVSAMLHSPLVWDRAEPLFDQVIMQSGSVFSPKAICDSPVEGALDIANRAGCSDPSTIEDCLQSISLYDLFKAFNEHRKEALINQGYPSIAGACIIVGGPSGLFPEHPTYYLQRPPKGVVVMAGATSQEGFYLLEEIAKLQPELFPTVMPSYRFSHLLLTIHKKFGHTRIDGALNGYQLLATYLKDEMGETNLSDLIPGLVDICGNHVIKGPMLIDLHAMQRVSPVHLYSFDFNGRSNKTVPDMLEEVYKTAVNHAEELDYLFPRRHLDERELGMVRVMTQLWTSFVISGVPSAEGVPLWPEMSELSGPYLKINDQMEVQGHFLDEFTATQKKYRVTKKGSNKAMVVS